MRVVIHRTEIEKPLLAGKCFNTYSNSTAVSCHVFLVTCMSAVLCAQVPTCTDVHLKRFCMHENF